ncbi:MAG: 1-hydroxycarotenoid 3,4-desaturase CrtD [Pseudomonadota bacterium]
MPAHHARPKVIVVGAGIAGLAASLELAHHGLHVQVFEAQDQLGGKMRRVSAAGRQMDGGPTVFTMDWAFRGLFEAVGERFDDHLRLTAADVLARHGWSDGSRLDLYADLDRSVQAVHDFAGPREAAAFLEFCRRAERLFEAMRPAFMERQRPHFLQMANRLGPRIGLLRDMAPHLTLAQMLSGVFEDPRLRQLFGRYATYVGGAPQTTPALMSLIWHAERSGVFAVEGGMHEIVRTLAKLIEQRGGEVRSGAPVETIELGGGRARRITLQSGETAEADAVLFNGDVAALNAGLLGPGVKEAALSAPARSTKSGERSLSALTAAIVAKPEGFNLSHHTIFFSDTPGEEFMDIQRGGSLPRAPSIYFCAQDRAGGGAPEGPERLFTIINAPANGDEKTYRSEDAQRCFEEGLRLAERCGLTLDLEAGGFELTTPTDYSGLFPATGGALYGRSPAGRFSALSRPGARSRTPGLYLAGGSVHPGPGAPMAALSGRLAAQAILEDLAA